MDNVKIVTDSAANVPAELAENLGIEVIPFTLTLNARSFREGVDLSPENFYKRRDLYHTMTSAAPLYHDYALVYMRLVKENKKIVFIHSSSAFSSTFETACAVHRDFRASHGAKAVVLDSGSYGMGLAIAVMALARAARAGLPIHRLISLAVKLRQEVRYILGVGNTKLMAETWRPRGLAALTGKASFYTFDSGGSPAPYKGLAAKKGRMVLDLVQHVRKEIGDETVITGLEGTDGERLYGALSGAVTEVFNCESFHVALARPSLGISLCPDAFGLAYLKSGVLAPFLAVPQKNTGDA